MMMNKDYEKELSDLKYRMEKAERFAKKLPVFSEKILQNKTSGDEPWIKFGNNYKSLYCAWGINRGLYEKGTSREATNYTGEPYKEYLFSVYINTLSLYDSHEKFGLEAIKDSTPLFYYDCSNSTFYATDSQAEGLLDALVAWYEAASEKIVAFNKKKEIKKLQDRLEELAE